VSKRGEDFVTTRFLRSRGLRGAAALGLFVTALIAARALAGPDPLTQPVRDGCARDREAIFLHEVPNWVYVNDGDHPADGPPPPQRWAHGVALSKYKRDLSAHPTGVDDPLTHTSYDFVFNLRADPADSYLLGGSESEGNGNYADGNEEAARLHTERESGSFPRWAWPDRGDRVSLRGSWVWDCDHASPTGEHTEIHPFHAIWVERNPGGASPSSPSGDAEGDFFASDAATPADDQADCAHRTKGDRKAFKACLDDLAITAHDRIDITGRYVFFLRAPPRPSRRAHLAYRARHASPRPMLTPERNGVKVTFDVPAATTTAAGRIFVGWRPVRRRPVHLRLRLRELLVRRAMDPGCRVDRPRCKYRNESTRLGQLTSSPGEWNVYVDAAGVWRQWRPAIVRSRDGKRIRGHQRIDFYVGRGKPWRLFVQTRECDFGALGNAFSPKIPVWPCPRSGEVGNAVGDDIPGILVRRFRSPAASLGLHTTNARLEGSTCPPANRRGCYALTYSVTRVSSPGHRKQRKAE
jgi:hypothetical protein